MQEAGIMELVEHPAGAPSGASIVMAQGRARRRRKALLLRGAVVVASGVALPRASGAGSAALVTVTGGRLPGAAHVSGPRHGAAARRFAGVRTPAAADVAPHHRWSLAHVRRRQQYLRGTETAAPVGVPVGGTRKLWSLFLGLFVHSTLLMSFSLASLVLFVQLECGHTALDWRPFRAGAAESVAVYCLDHLRDIKKKKERSATAGWRAHDGPAGTDWNPVMLSLLFVVALCSFTWTLATAPSPLVAAIFFSHIISGIIYAKLKPYMPYMKAIYVSACVVFMALAAPAAYVPGLLASLGWRELTRLVLLILGVAFTVENLQDVRDIDEDRKANVVTLPSGLGRRWTVRLLVGVHVLCGLAQWSLATTSLRPEFLAVHALCALMASAVLRWRRALPYSFFQVALEPLYVAPLFFCTIRRFALV